jgi:hypothetical protein
MKTEIISLKAVKAAQPAWFSAENRRFFRDVRYWVKRGSNGLYYFVRSTYAWSDMFGAPNRLHYRINQLDQNTLKISHLVTNEFATMADVDAWLKKD